MKKLCLALLVMSLSMMAILINLFLFFSFISKSSNPDKTDINHISDANRGSCFLRLLGKNKDTRHAGDNFQNLILNQFLLFAFTFFKTLNTFS